MSPTVPPELARRFLAVRAATETLVAGLSAEDLQVQSMPDASPGKWHLAHTTWFFETFVLVELAGQTPANPDFNYLYNSYYDAMGGRHPRPQRGLLTRPTLEQVLSWRRQVDEAVVQLLVSDTVAGLPERVELGLQHEQQHQELLITDLKHLFAQNPMAPVWRELPEPGTEPAPAMTWRRYQGGLVEIGHQGPGFAFDNELPRHRIHLQPFELASRPVSVGEYLQFMADEGYRRPELWLAEGYTRAAEEGWSAPLYWRSESGGWLACTAGGMRRLDPGEPVCHLSHFEADAYARWAGARLPTEGEWEHAYAETPVSLRPARFHPTALSAEAAPGEVWEWTASAYVGYPGFRAGPGALGEYNGKFMSNQMVLRGASCATAAGHGRSSYRNFFPSAARWQFSGLRLARDP